MTDFASLDARTLRNLLTDPSMGEAAQERIRARLVQLGPSGNPRLSPEEMRDAALQAPLGSKRAVGAPSSRARAESAQQRSGRGAIWFPLDPVAKPRQTQRDKWEKRAPVTRWRCFADAIRAQAEREGFTFPEHGATVIFYLRMPSSWAEKYKAKMYLQPHQQTPDLDNLLKALVDALVPDDARISGYGRVEKLWDYKGSILVEAPSGLNAGDVL